MKVEISLSKGMESLQGYEEMKRGVDFIAQNHSCRMSVDGCAVAFDLGSNTLRAVVLECGSGEFIHSFEKIVSTADGLAKSGRISDAAVDRIVNAVKEAVGSFDMQDCTMDAVTTEAFRRALNAQEALSRIEKESGISFRVIDGESEAGYTLLAVRERLKRLGAEAENIVLVDIGGGSTELVVAQGEEFVARSFSLGIVTLAQSGDSIEDIHAKLEIESREIAAFFESVKPDAMDDTLFVATAGTPTTIAALRLGMDYYSYDARRVNGTTLTPRELEECYERLRLMEQAQRERAVGVGRGDLIAAGILIFLKLFEIVCAREALVIDDGLREGVALSLCRRGTTTL